MVEHSQCEQLLKIATPSLYQNNLFRILKIPVTASAADVRRRQKRLTMEAKLGVGKSEHGKGYFGYEDSPSEADIVKALDRLNDPEARLLDEIFWFWPQVDSTANDPALSALEQGNVDEALQLWTKQTEQDPSDLVALHNLALLDHIIILDYEKQQSQCNDDKQNATVMEEHIVEVWERVYDRWTSLLQNNEFRNWIKQRVSEFDDARLTTGFIHRSIETLPKALLQINARIALERLEQNKKDGIQHIQLIRKVTSSINEESAFGNLGKENQVIGTKVLQEVLEPIRQRVKALCEDAGTRIDKEPKDGNEIALDFLEHTKPLLEIIDHCLAQDDPILQGVHDQIAITGMQCSNVYGNETEAWDKSLKLLEAVLPIAVTASAKDRINQNLTTVRNNYESRMCYYCEINLANDEVAVKVNMHGDVKQVGNQITWNHLTIDVPCCFVCDKAHVKEGSAGCLMLLLMLFLGGLFGISSAFVGLFISLVFFEVEGILINIVVCAIAFFVGLQLVKPIFDLIIRMSPIGKMKFRSDVDNFREIKNLLNQGWEFGSEPQND